MPTGFRVLCFAMLAALFSGKAHAEQPAKPLDPPDFFLRISLPPDAEAWLQKTGESIWIWAMFEDEIGPDGLWLGRTELTLTKDRVAHIHNVELNHKLARLLAGFDYEVLVNVGSGRKTTDVNVLECEPLQGTISQFQGRTSQIDCTLVKGGPPPKYAKRFTGQMNAKEFLSICSSAGLAPPTRSTRKNEDFCVGYVKGVIHAHEGFLGDDGLAKRHFCIPRQVSDLDFTRAVVKHLEAHDARDFLGTYTLAALHVAYPCKVGVP